MTQKSRSRWKARCTDETRFVEEFLRTNGRFEQVDAYRYNSGSIRLRVIDSRFENLPIEKRDAKVEKFLHQLPEETQRDIMILLTFAPTELQATPETAREALQNLEFENPSRSRL